MSSSAWTKTKIFGSQVKQRGTLTLSGGGNMQLEYLITETKNWIHINQSS